MWLVGCAACTHVSCLHVWRRGRRRRARGLTLSVRARRCPVRSSGVSGEDRTHRRCRDATDVSSRVPRCTEIRRGSPHTGRNPGGSCGVDPVRMCRPGSTVALCANEGCARTHVSKHFFSLRCTMRLKLGGWNPGWNAPGLIKSRDVDARACGISCTCRSGAP